MDLVIRRPIESFYNKSKFHLAYKLSTNVRYLLEMEDDVLSNREDVSNLIFKCIKYKIDDNERRKLINLRRKIYHTPNPYSIEDIGYEIYYLSNTEIDTLYKDICKRKLINTLHNNIKNQFINNSMQIKQYLSELIYDDNFITKVYATNKDLFNLIQNKNSLKKSQYITLLKYLYKEENCCTPSSCWSGLSIVKNTDCYNNDLVVFGEKNKHFQKHHFREKIINSTVKEIENYNLKFYVNTTLIKKDNNYYYRRNEMESTQTVKVVSNQILDSLYKNYRYAKLDFNQLYKITGGEIITLIKYDLIRICDSNLYGKYDMKELDSTNIIKTDFDYYTCRFPNTFIDKVINQKICFDTEESMNIYYRLLKLLYLYVDNSKYNGFINRIKENKQTLLEFLHDKSMFNPINKLYRKNNYRAWPIPESEEGKKNYNILHNLICKKIDEKNCDTVIISRDEMDDVFHNELKNIEKINCDIVYQYDYSNGVVIPEMSAIGYGRLVGRYLKYLPQNFKNDFFAESYYNDEDTQVNLELNKIKDNLGYDIPILKKKLILYDLNTDNENNDILTLDDVYICENNGFLYFSDAYGKKLNLICTSTVSPGTDKLYSLINLVNRNYIAHDLNGQCYTRLELDLDYQPRIIIGNLLISRKRIRVKAKELENVLNVKDILNCYAFKEKNRIPDEFYVYCDKSYKPLYGRIACDLDISILLSIAKSADKYVYFEEVYPSAHDNIEISKYNMEFWRNIWLN